MEKIVDLVKSGVMEPFSLISDKEEVSFWTYYFDNYGYETDEGLHEAFVIVRHPDKPRFFIKTKGATEIVDVSPQYNQEILAVSRPEEVIRVDRTYAKTDADVIIAFQQERLGKSVRFVGTNRRTKYYVFLYNQTSGRYYNLSADLCIQDETKMSQLELEYKGTGPKFATQNSFDTVMKEIGTISKYLARIPGFLLQPTTLRKFDWLKKLQGIR